MEFKQGPGLQVPAHCVRGSGSATLTGAFVPVSLPCVCVSACVRFVFACASRPLSVCFCFFSANHERLLGKTGAKQRAAAASSQPVQPRPWPTDPVIHKHQLHSVSAGHSLITLPLWTPASGVGSLRGSGGLAGTNFIGGNLPFFYTAREAEQRAKSARFIRYLNRGVFWFQEDHYQITTLCLVLCVWLAGVCVFGPVFLNPLCVGLFF